jgi:single-stranded-DNA-specific exonuclease
VVVCSDYDVDGLSSGTIITDCIRQCGGRVQMLVSSRFNMGGYGLTDKMVDRVLAVGRVSTVVTCDFGGSDHERIKRLKDNGILTCVIDHHVTPLAPLPSYAFLNPHREGCRSTFKNLCSGGLALSVAGGVLRELGIPSSTIDPMQWVELAGIASVCDVVELQQDNRAITRKALEIISTNPSPGIRALLELSKFNFADNSASGRTIGFQIGPPLNSPGRLGDPDIIVDLLMSKDLTEARQIAAEIKQIWDKRRVITDEVTAECIKQVDSNGYAHDPAIVLFSGHWGHGIVGISAARLVDKFKVPVCVIGHEGRGSLRGPPGSKLHTALSFCKEHLLKWGGHEAASGCQCAPESVEAFRQKFNEFFQNNPPVPPKDQFDPILELDLSDNLLTVCENLQLLEPCGQSNPRPTLQTSGTIKSMKFVKGDHLKFDLLLPNNVLLPCFKIVANENKSLTNNQKVTVQGDLRKNTWNGKTKAEMFVSNIL